MRVTAALARQYHSLDLSHSRGLFPEVVDKGVGMGASYVFGQLHGRYREKADIMGVPMTLAAGVVGSGLAFGLEMFAPGIARHASHHLNTIANAGLYNYAYSKGVSAGTEDSGRKVFVLNKGAAIPAGLPAPTTVVGEIPPSPTGTFLNPDEIRHFRRQR